MEEVKIQHISGDVEIHLKGNEVQIRDLFTEQQGLAEFPSSKEAMRFVAEYLSNVEGPTEEFQRLFPQIV